MGKQRKSITRNGGLGGLVRTCLRSCFGWFGLKCSSASSHPEVGFKHKRIILIEEVRFIIIFLFILHTSLFLVSYLIHDLKTIAKRYFPSRLTETFGILSKILYDHHKDTDRNKIEILPDIG